MLLEGTIRNGTIVLDQPPEIPEGARVDVDVKEKSEQTTEQGQTLRELLLTFAGCLSDLPADFAEQHDHYIHGTPKR